MGGGGAVGGCELPTSNIQLPTFKEEGASGAGTWKSGVEEPLSSLMARMGGGGAVGGCELPTSNIQLPTFKEEGKRGG